MQCDSHILEQKRLKVDLVENNEDQNYIHF